MVSRRKNSGFTLIEVILVILLVAIISGITSNLILFGADSYRLQYHRRDLMYQLKNAIVRMDKEIRMINSASAADILTFTSNTLKFNSISGDEIEFSLSGNNILRTLNGTANTLCKDISALTISYYKKDGTAAAAPAEIWTISVDITVSGEETIRMRTRIFLRDVHGIYTSWREV
ncbi:type II secretion system protein J [Thermodesulfobacteriota bacterium]